MRIRAATPADLALLRAWDRQPRVVAASGADGTFDWEFELPRDVPWRELLIAESADRAIGMLQIIDPAEEETHYWGEIAAHLRAIDIWIGDAADRNRGYGAYMMELAHARCFADPHVTAIVIDPLASNARAIAFYRRLGYGPIGRQMFGEDDCHVHRLERTTWQQQQQTYSRSET